MNSSALLFSTKKVVFPINEATKDKEAQHVLSEIRKPYKMKLCLHFMSDFKFHQAITSISISQQDVPFVRKRGLFSQRKANDCSGLLVLSLQLWNTNVFKRHSSTWQRGGVHGWWRQKNWFQVLFWKLSSTGTLHVVSLINLQKLLH